MLNSIVIATGWIVPLLLILWRSPREPNRLAYVRYVVAVLVVWLAVMIVVSEDTAVRVREAQAQGDIDGAIADTGSNAGAFLFGWIPGLVYSGLIGFARWCWLRFRAQKQARATA